MKSNLVGTENYCVDRDRATTLTNLAARTSNPQTQFERHLWDSEANASTNASFTFGRLNYQAPWNCQSRVCDCDSMANLNVMFAAAQVNSELVQRALKA